ncbi:MAG: hypothetical protein CMC57_00065 [Flavobacteriaceae bacterium]|nr:hypothetical protein [Flavobacteriaceae bacterium]|tara:strand:+ start:3107 stop:4036 length:930 start_codon:yes stop_codon:yes gene_type:complete
MKKFSISIIMIFCLQLILAQKDKISLYPEGIPCKSNLETELDYDSSGRIFKKVSDPEIWYYPSDKMKGKENNVAVLVIPGGGYWGLWFDKEGVDVAKWLNNIGVSAFVLKHRLPHWESKDCRSKVALMDAQRAMRIIRKNSKIWDIDPNKIGVLGFSAGGHLASTLSTHHDNGLDLSDLKIEKISSRPDFSILVYPVITMNRPYAHNGSRENLLGKIPSQEYLDYYSNDLQVREDTPPAILIHSDDDKGVLPENSIQYYLALRKYNIPAALHIWEDGGHGYGLGNDKGSIKSWAKICEEWMIQREIINL